MICVRFINDNHGKISVEKFITRSISLTLRFYFNYRIMGLTTVFNNCIINNNTWNIKLSKVHQLHRIFFFVNEAASLRWENENLDIDYIQYTIYYKSLNHHFKVLIVAIIIGFVVFSIWLYRHVRVGSNIMNLPL